MYSSCIWISQPVTRQAFFIHFFHGCRPMENKWWWGTRSSVVFELTSWSLKKYQKTYWCWPQQCWFVQSGFGKKGPELQSQASEIYTRCIIPATFFSAFIWQELSLVGSYLKKKNKQKKSHLFISSSTASALVYSLCAQPRHGCVSACTKNLTYLISKLKDAELVSLVQA